jgi:hypothetical protein
MRQTIAAIPVERPQPTPDQPQNLCLDKGYDYDECKRGKSPGGFGDRPYRSAVGRQKMAEFRAIRSDSERMLHVRARTFAPLTILNLPPTRPLLLGLRMVSVSLRYSYALGRL